MKLRTASFIIAVSLCAHTGAYAAGETQSLKLLKPRTGGGKPLMQALKERRSSREISGKELPPQLLSDLLWAAFGVNRPDSGKRTAPSAMNWQEIRLYVAMPKGLYLYNAAENVLEQVIPRDIRPASGLQPAAQAAPVLLLYVADPEKMGKAKQDMQDFYSATDTGFISQNVYLFCASEDLATVVMGGFDRPRLAKELGLRPEQKVVLIQPVGYPRQEEKTTE